MKLALRLGSILALILIILYSIFRVQVNDRFDQYGVGTYVKQKVKSTFKGATLEYLPPLAGVTGNKVIVMAKLEKEDTRWVTEELSESVIIQHCLDMY